jgi:hypothetical protein
MFSTFNWQSVKEVTLRKGFSEYCGFPLSVIFRKKSHIHSTIIRSVCNGPIIDSNSRLMQSHTIMRELNGSNSPLPLIKYWIQICFIATNIEASKFRMFQMAKVKQSSNSSIRGVSKNFGEWSHLCWQFPEALWTLPIVCCEGWRLFWRSMKLICLYLLFCLFSGTIHRTF